ncbi:hypothetical protein, partial [Fluviicola sp.]|uniref:hypothetical protein n=1 Tax=Fluviicola sp. TaxID=1917219 RepID=UPI00281E0508
LWSVVNLSFLSLGKRITSLSLDFYLATTDSCIYELNLRLTSVPEKSQKNSGSLSRLLGKTADLNVSYFNCVTRNYNNKSGSSLDKRNENV